MFFSLLQSQNGGGIGSYIPIIAMVAVFYFFFIRPQRKKQKEVKKFINEIKKGDKIVTVGGVHGKILEITTATVLLDVDRGTKLLVEKSSVSLESSKKLNESSGKEGSKS